MTDIVERLRHGCSCNFPDTPCGAEEECRAAFDAADEITRLRADNERLLAANRDVMLHWEVLKADYERLRAALRAAFDAGSELGWDHATYSERGGPEPIGHEDAFAAFLAALDGQPALGKEEA